MVVAGNVVPRKVPLSRPRSGLDLSAIDAVIGPKTKLVIVNTPHSPTGRIYAADVLQQLASVLECASRRIGHRIYLLSDEPYRRLRFDARKFDSPAAFYPWTFISSSYGKVLLSPGQRLGYMAISPLTPREDRRAFQEAAFPAQLAISSAFPTALLQYAIPDLGTLSLPHVTLRPPPARLIPAILPSFS